MVQSSSILFYFFGFQRPFHDGFVKSEKVNVYKADHASVKADYSPVKSALVH